MKKLLIAMTAVSALSVFAEGLSNTTGFEAYEVDAQITIGTGSDPYWLSEDPDETGTVKAYADGEAPTDAGAKYLAVENSKTLYRTALEPTIDEELKPVAQEVPIEDGLVFDTLVKFTCRDTLDVPTLDDGAKIAVWAGYNGDSEEENVPTNLYVTAAGVTSLGEISTVNFKLGADIDFFDWHRVTIRADKEIGKDEFQSDLIGFKVWVDEQLVAVAGDAMDDYLTAVDATMISDKKALDARAIGQLFVGRDTGTKLAAMGFNGQGSVDNIGAFDNANAPAFAKVAEGFTLTWDAEAISALAVNGEDVLDIAAESFFVPAGSAEAIVATVTFNEGYESKVGETQRFNFADKTGKIDATFAAVKIGDKAYATIAEAIAEAKSGDTIKLNVNINETVSSMYTIAETDITFDLNGKAWTIDQGDAVVFYTADGVITVIDSIGGGVMTVTTELEETSGIFYAEATGLITIGTDADKGVTINGMLASELPVDNFIIVRGKFDKENNTTDDAFTFAGNVEGDPEEAIKDAGDFWAVNMGDEPEPEKYAVTWNEPDYTEVLATLDDGTIINSGDKFVKDTRVKFTATPMEGYTYEGVDTSDWEAEGTSIAKYFYVQDEDLQVTIPAPMEVTEEEIPEEIEGGSDEQKKAYADWVKTIEGAPGQTAPIYAVAFALSLTQADITAAGDITKAAEEKLASIITAEMVNQIVAKGFDKVDFSALAETYPNAQFEFVVAPEIPAEEGVSGFYRLKASFKPANAAK